MNRKEDFLVCTLIFVALIGTVFATTSPASSTSPTLQTTSVDIEILNVARESGIFIAPQTANFTAAFSFAPQKGFVQVTNILLTIEWNQLSLGHVGDRFSIQLNSQTPVIATSLASQTTQVTMMPRQDLRSGSNLLNLVVIPVDAALATNYLLYEVRMTVEYTFLA